MANIFLPPVDRRFLFLDMNAFFAQCEQQANPALRGRPVGVAPYTGETGCVIAASYEAKRQGVKTGQLVWQARRLVPDLIVVEPDTAKYRAVHHAILSVLAPYGPYQVKSIDEIALPLWPNERRAALSIARFIKADLRAAVGEYLTSSIGIGPNLFYAKLASELEKPDGLVEITMGKAREVLGRLKLTALPGINRRMEARLFALGFMSPVMLFEAPIETLRQALGIWGDYWYLRLHGLGIDETDFARRSVGHSHVLEPKLRFPRRARAVLRKLVERAGYRLRRDNLWARGVALDILFLHGFHWKASRQTPLFQDNLTFWEEVVALLGHCPYREESPLRLSVSAFDVVELHSRPLSFIESREKRIALARAMDAVNNRYGLFSLQPASLIGFESAAPDRIPFGRPDV